MALNIALVDLARPLTRRVATAEKVGGSTPMVEETGAWFKARLQLGASAESVDAAGGRRRSVARPQLLYGRKDKAGEPVLLRSNARVEVVSTAQFGPDPVVFEVDGDPEPLRRRRSLVGWQATLRRVDA